VAKLPDLPARLKPFATDELDDEDRRNQAALRRADAAFGDDGLIVHYRQIGDPLLQFVDIVALVIEMMPDKTPPELIHRFVLSTKMGAFPVHGTGLGPHDTVKDLFDFVHLRAASDLDFTPTLLTIEEAPLAMLARCSDWVKWLGVQSLPVHPVLAQGLVIDHQLDNRGISVEQRVLAAEPASSGAGKPPKQQPLPSGRGNTAYNDEAMVESARGIYRNMPKPTKPKAAQQAIEKFKQDNPEEERRAISEKARIDRISRRI